MARCGSMMLAAAGWLAMMLRACAAPAARQGGPASSDAPAGVRADARPSRVTIAIGGEVTTLASKLEPSRTYGADFGFISNSPIVVKDAQGRTYLLLAGEAPSRDTGTWTVNPDGTMATTWKIKPNARWHDGAPVVTRDFIRALKVYADESMGVREREPERFMERIDQVDDKTFVIYWKQTYPWAHELLNRQLEPLPDHVMGRVYDAGDKEAFLNHSFWSSTAYVGTGPYRLVQWDPGAQLVYRAFQDYFMGPPRIDDLVLRIIPDTNTVISNLLAGAVDTTVAGTLGQQGGDTIKSQWGASGEGEVLVTPVRWRYSQIQFDPARSQQPALLDARVRRAIVFGLDRETIAQVVTVGNSPAADVPLSPFDPLYPAVQQTIAKYPYDPGRAAALRRFVGTNRGCWRNADYDRFFITAYSALDTRERDAATVQALKILTEEVGIFGLSYSSENLAVRKGLVGPGPRWPPQVGNTWNIHEWYWQ